MARNGIEFELLGGMLSAGTEDFRSAGCDLISKASPFFVEEVERLWVPLALTRPVTICTPWWFRDCGASAMLVLCQQMAL